MNSLNVKKGDTVLVITGKKGKEGIKGKQGRVISADPSSGKVIVDGLRMQKRHTKAKSAKAQSGIIEQAGAIDISNVMVVCPKCGKPTRVGHSIDENGKKIRVCKRKDNGEVCGASLDKGLKIEKKQSKKAEDAAAKKTAVKAEETPAKKTAAKKVTAESKTTVKKAVDKAAEKPAEKPAEKSAEKTAEKPAVKKTAAKKAGDTAASSKKTAVKADTAAAEKKTAAKKATAEKAVEDTAKADAKVEV